MTSPRFGTIIGECRQIAPPPRELGVLAQQQLVPVPPTWIRADPLQLIYTQYPRLMREGRIVWAHLVQANNQLFKPGTTDCPANALYSFDAYFDEQPLLLGNIARSLFAAKGERVNDLELQKFGDELADEMKRTFALPVPTSLANGRHTVFTTLMVVRKHLPQGYLANGLFPLLVLPEVTQATLILPASFWPAALVKYWTG